MQNQIARIGVFVAATAALASAALPVNASLLYATNGSSIARFDDGALGVVTSVPITGLQAGESIVDIDVRPAPTAPGVQTLYGIGSTSRLYTVNPTTGAATQVGAGSSR